MEETSLLSLPEGMLIEQIQITENGPHHRGRCHLCHIMLSALFRTSSSIHCHYRRVLHDVPCAGRCVQLVLTFANFPAAILTPTQSLCRTLPAIVSPWAR